VKWFQDIPQPIKEITANLILAGTAFAGITGPMLLLVGMLPTLAIGLTQVAGALGVLRAAMIAHPVTAIATALGLAANAIADYLAMKQKQEQTEINTGKTAEQRIKAHKDAIKALRRRLIELGTTEEDSQRRLIIMTEWKRLDMAIDRERHDLRMQQEKEQKRLEEERKQRRKQQLDEDLANQQKYIEQIIAGRMQQAEVVRQIENTTMAQRDAHFKLVMQMEKERLQTATNMAQAIYNAYTTGFGTAFQRMALEGKNFVSEMNAVWEDMKRTFVRLVGEMIAKWLTFQALTAVFGGGFFTTGIGRFMSLQMGGVVPGPIGKPRLVMAHGGEEFAGVNRTLKGQEPGINVTNQVNIESLTTENKDRVLQEITEAIKEGNEQAQAMAKSVYNEGKNLEGEAV
jgi:hypothetical protein